jgi:hypothetical protein
MSRHPELYQWIAAVSNHFPRLSKPLATGLALWSFGMIVARSCGLTAVAGILAPLLGQQFNTVRERLRDIYREADAKVGPWPALNSRSPTAGHHGWPGCWKAGLGRDWRLPSMPLRGGNDLSCWPSVCSTAAVPYRSQGRSCRPRKSTPGNRNGWPCWSDSATWCPRTGR